MPTIPSYTKCQHLGCTNTRSKLNSYCLEHGGKTGNYSDERNKFNKMYQSTFWKRLRRVQLGKQPICQACLHSGKVSESKHIDHVFPWAHIGEHAFIANIFQALCPECHSHKTSLEARGIYRHYSHTIVDYTAGDYIRVVSQKLFET